MLELSQIYYGWNRLFLNQDKFLNFAKSKGFLKYDGTVTSTGLDLANYMSKSDTWIPVEWEIGIPYVR